MKPREVSYTEDPAYGYRIKYVNGIPINFVKLIGSPPSEAEGDR